MKNLKVLSMMFGCVAALCATFSSCTSDDGPKSLTKEEVQTAFLAVKGTHTGKIIYEAKNKDNVNDNADTLNISWEIATDSTLVVNNFPMKVIANYIADTDLKEAVSNMPDQNLECRIGFYKVSPAGFLINPKTPTASLTYGGKMRKYQLAFYVNSPFSFGAINSKNQLVMQVVAAAIYLDGKQTRHLSDKKPFVFVADKK